MGTSRRRFVYLSAGIAGVPLIVGCGGGTDDPGAIQGWASSDIDTGTVTKGQPGGVPVARARVGLVPGVIVISGIQFAGDDSFIRLTNLNTAIMTMIDWQLSAGSAHWALPDIELEPEQVLDVGLSEGLDTEAKVFTNNAFLDFSPVGGELALYSSTNFERASAMVHYVQWGKAGGLREAVAVTAGVWEAAKFIDAEPLANGGVLEYDGRIPGQGNWVARAGTL